MNAFDRKIRTKIHQHEEEVPSFVRLKIEQTLDQLPEYEDRKAYSKRYRKPVLAFASIVFVFLFLLPNVSSTYAKTIQQIPIIGEFVKVVTIRNYMYKDPTHELEVHVPKIEQKDNPAMESINKESEKLIHSIVAKFYKEMQAYGEQAHGATYVNYEVITNNKKWFTLKLCISEVSGSSNTYYKYYNVDKMSGKVTKLDDLVKNREFYTVVEQEIKKQMRLEMEHDENVKYWLESSFGEDFVKVGTDHNYYWNKDGDLVIVYNKYDVAPGAMGTPEFVIKKALIQPYVK